MPYLVTADAPPAGQFVYLLSPGEAFTPSSVSASWDGSGAAGTFLACLSIYAPSGELIGRVFPDQELAAGDTAECTYAPFLRTDQASSAAASAIYPGDPAMLDLFSSPASQHDTSNWSTVTVDNAVRHNAYLENVGATGDYFTRYLALGPRGSLWGLVVSYKAGPDCGVVAFELASVASPNPNRGGSSDAGTLTDDPLSYVTLASVDMYAAGAADATNNGTLTFRLNGADGAALTAIGPSTDPYTGFKLADGGAGIYAVKARVTGKNAASAGFHARITELGLVRLADQGFF